MPRTARYERPSRKGLTKLKEVHRKGTVDSEEETTSEEDETCKMGGAEWKEEERDRGLLCNVGFSIFVPFSG